MVAALESNKPRPAVGAFLFIGDSASDESRRVGRCSRADGGNLALAAYPDYRSPFGIVRPWAIRANLTERRRLVAAKPALSYLVYEIPGVLAALYPAGTGKGGMQDF